MEPKDGTNGIGVRSVYVAVSKWKYIYMLRLTDNFAFFLDVTAWLFDENRFIAGVFGEIIV